MDVNFEYYQNFLLCGKIPQLYQGSPVRLNNSQPNITRAMNCLEQQLTYHSIYPY